MFDGGSAVVVSEHVGQVNTGCDAEFGEGVAEVGVEEETLCRVAVGGAGRDDADDVQLGSVLDQAADRDRGDMAGRREALRQGQPDVDQR